MCGVGFACIGNTRSGPMPLTCCTGPGSHGWAVRVGRDAGAIGGRRIPYVRWKASRRAFVEVRPGARRGWGDGPLRCAFGDLRLGSLQRINLCEGPGGRARATSQPLKPPGEGAWASVAPSWLIAAREHSFRGAGQWMTMVLSFRRLPAAVPSCLIRTRIDRFLFEPRLRAPGRNCHTLHLSRIPSLKYFGICRPHIHCLDASKDRPALSSDIVKSLFLLPCDLDIHMYGPNQGE